MNVATNISMIKKKQDSRFIKPKIKNSPPKNSVVLHKYELREGKGIFAVFRVLAKSTILLL